ncbi:hypothetical protein NDU88_001584 [Pleurodeles waltl]|uniref:Uncharacterized protein n=1 Tax=Pleurodeles waltl TaxID=8319 RepID=A0AAV7SZU9_PLEWA|nr:hypothetical protein NDU88_001584 [Pleurodeles waltl]
METRTDASSVEREDRNSNIGTRAREEGDQATSADLQEQEKGGKRSGANGTRTGEGVIRQHSDPDELEDNAIVWSDIDWFALPEMLLHSATVQKDCDLGGEC